MNNFIAKLSGSSAATGFADCAVSLPVLPLDPSNRDQIAAYVSGGRNAQAGGSAKCTE